jgi:hypothetical protein
VLPAKLPDELERGGSQRPGSSPTAALYVEQAQDERGGFSWDATSSEQAPPAALAAVPWAAPATARSAVPRVPGAARSAAPLVVRLARPRPRTTSSLSRGCQGPRQSNRGRRIGRRRRGQLEVAEVRHHRLLTAWCNEMNDVAEIGRDHTTTTLSRTECRLQPIGSSMLPTREPSQVFVGLRRHGRRWSEADGTSQHWRAAPLSTFGD